MRMWMVDPREMCRQHLLGEHVEIHMLLGAMRLGKSLDGFIDNGLIEPASIEVRHESLVVEMLRRGYKHKSPISTEWKKHLTPYLGLARVDSERSRMDLIRRCDQCFGIHNGGKRATS